MIAVNSGINDADPDTVASGASRPGILRLDPIQSRLIAKFLKCGELHQIQRFRQEWWRCHG